MKTAVIGCGNISGCHFSALEKTPGAEIAAAVDIKYERAQRAAQKYGARAYTDYIEMLDEIKPDCVHICTPHYLHAEMSAECLRRGINVLCEKPCAMDRDGLHLIEEVPEGTSARFGVCFQNRYNESVGIVRDVLSGGSCGKIICARAAVHWRREKEYYSDDWHGTKDKEGGGVLINQAVHTLDLLRYLLGEDMKYVTGHTFCDKFGDVIEVEDTVNARFETESGIIALFSATVAAGIDHPVMIDIVCEKCTLRIEGNSAYRIVDGNFERLYLDENRDFVGRRYWGNGHESLILDFYDCLETGRRFPVDFSEGKKAVKEFLAVYESAQKGKRVIIK